MHLFLEHFISYSFDHQPHLVPIPVCVGVVGNSFVRLDTKTLEGTRVKFEDQNFQFLFISQRVVKKRALLLSSISFDEIISFPGEFVLSLIRAGCIGYYAFTDDALFCVNHVDTIYFKPLQTVEDIHILPQCRPRRFLAVHGWPSPQTPLQLATSVFNIVHMDPTDLLLPRLKNGLGSICIHDIILFEGEVPTTSVALDKYDVIITRVRGSVPENIRMLLEKSSTLSKSDVAEPVTLTYCGDPNKDRFSDAVFPLLGNGSVLLTHLLSACILFRNRKVLESSLGVTAF